VFKCFTASKYRVNKFALCFGLQAVEIIESYSWGVMMSTCIVCNFLINWCWIFDLLCRCEVEYTM